MEYTITRARALTKEIRGWLHDWEGRLLFRLSHRCAGKGVIVEIGSYCGKSTVWLGYGSKTGRGVKIFAIDPHPADETRNSSGKESDTYQELHRNIRLAKIDDIIETIAETSDEAATKFDQPIELIFIDGDHSYESTISDCRNWYPKVIEGGTMAFHDARGHEKGVQKALLEFVYKSNRFKKIRVVRNTLYATKVAENTSSDRFMNGLMLRWHDSKALVVRCVYDAATTLGLATATDKPH